MEQYDLLDQADEDAVHAARLLNIEEKLLKRLTKRLLSPTAPINPRTKNLSTPPPENAKGTEARVQTNGAHDYAAKRNEWRTDVELDFAAFESNLVRTQFLLNSNEKERARYAAEKDRIQTSAERVRVNNVSLHEQLKMARAKLAIRKNYDALAETITSNRMLKPRDEQAVALEKLKKEILELESEKVEYAKTWADRRNQFGKIVEEGMQMLRLIRDEKEEADRKEGLDDLDDDSQAESKGGMSGMVTLPPSEGSQAKETPQNDQIQAQILSASRGGIQASPLSQHVRTPVSAEVDMNDGDSAVLKSARDDEAEIEDGEETEDMEPTVGYMDTT